MIINLRILNKLFVLISRLFKTFLLVIFLMFSFRVFAKFPLGDLYLQAEMIVQIFLVLFVVFYLLDLSRKTNQFLIPEFFAIGVAGFTIYCALMAYIQFGQPFITGIITNRQFLLGLSGIFVFYLIKNDIVDLISVKRSFLFLVWFTLVLYLFLIMVLPGNVIDGTRLYDTSLAKGGAVYRYDATFIVFGIIYYAIKALIKSSFKPILFVLILISYLLIFQKGRGLLVSTLIPIFIYFCLKVSWSKKVIIGVGTSIVVSSVIIYAYLTNPSSLNNFISSYENVFSVLSGQESGEASADSRILQVGKVLNFWESDSSKLLFGSGFLSNRWNGGFERIFGHFYPVDIGFFGITFVVGIFGLLYFKLQYLLSIKIWRKIKRVTSAQDVFIIALVYFILQIFFKSFLNGEDSFHSQKGIIVIFILYAYYIQATNLVKIIIKDQLTQPVN